MRRARHAPSARADRAPTAPAVVTIESIAAGGDGVARADGMVVFVPRTAPGDVAEIGLSPGARFARGVLRDIRTPGPDRVEPRCPHYTRDRCGGCQLQHLSIEGQRAAKSRIVADALHRIGHRDQAPPPVRSAGEPWRYRRKLTFAMRRTGGTWMAGLHAYDDAAKVFAVDDCPITDTRVLDAWRALLGAADDLPEAFELRGAVRVEDAEVSFALEGGSEWPRSAEFFARVPALNALWWTPRDGMRRRLHVRGDASATGASFAQVNARVAGVMQAHVLALAMAHEPVTMIDAYAGAGDTAAAAAAQGVRVTAIEMDEEAAAWCRERLPGSARTIAARVEDALAAAMPADVVVLNPPRAGVDARVTSELERAAAAVRAIVYVSCDPATLARDLARLPSWRLASVTCFDMFPQTAHVETVCELVPGGAAA